MRFAKGERIIAGYKPPSAWESAGVELLLGRQPALKTFRSESDGWFGPAGIAL